MKNKIIAAGLILSLLSSGLCAIAETETSDVITVIYDGEVIDFDVEPEIINDRTMVPMRAIFEAFGAKVKWDGETSTVTAKKKSKTISMTIGSSEMTKNDETYSFDTAPVISDGRTLVPIRAISDLLGLDVEWDEESKTITITTPVDEDSDEWKSNTGTIDLDSMTVSGSGVNVSDNIIEITEGGDFEVFGTLEDGMIHVNTDEKVKLRLSGASITNSSGPAIYFEDADKCYITLTEGTENYLEDGESYSDEDLKGCLSAKENLEIKGNGYLTITANYDQGIHASDSLEIANGNITVNSVGDAIHANDTIEISGGTVNVTAGGDGIQSEEILDISGGTVNVTTVGEVTSSSSMQGGMNFRGMTYTEDMADEEIQQQREEMQTQIEEMVQKWQDEEDAADESEEGSSKGIKADWMIDISGGEVNVNSTDHAIHCASEINIYGGEINLASSVKKGISGHGNVTVTDGSITITEATEGIESKEIITITGGDIDITCSDDGMNAGGNNSMDGGMMNNMMQNGGTNTQDAAAPDMSEGFSNEDMMQGGTAPEMQGEAQDGTAPQMQDRMQDGMQGGIQGGNRGGMGTGMQGAMQDGTAPQMQGEMQGGMAPGMQGETQDGMIPEMQGEAQSGMIPEMQGENQTEATIPEMADGQIEGDTSAEQDTNQTAGNFGKGQMGGGNGMMGSNSTEVSSEHHIQIDGGNIHINAQGDGIDSNGSLVITGGTIIVDGPTNSANSALDTDGLMRIDGGEVIAIGASGMMEIPGSTSAQPVLVYIYSQAQGEGTTLSVENADGDVIAEYTSEKSFESLIYSSDELEIGETYTIYSDGEKVDEITLTDTVTSSGTATGSAGGGFGGGRGNKMNMQNAQ